MSLARVAVHSSAFPHAVRLELLQSLRSRKVNHKFHYDSLKQTQKWLALHQAYSPSRTDPDCEAVYQQSFAAAVQKLTSASVHLIGLGCGGGQKDTALLRLLHSLGTETFYTPSDVSVSMVLVARQSALAVLPETNCVPLVCDLAAAQDLPAVLGTDQSPFSAVGKSVEAASLRRLFTFFGMIPNFEPESILPRLAGLLRHDDLLLLSANLAPGNDYRAGVERVMPLYDNALTRDWLMTFLLDLGVETYDGEVRFAIEEESAPVHLNRIAAHFHFTRDRAVVVDSERFKFKAGESIRLFFSYRHTPALVRALLSKYDFEVVGEWITRSQEEGVFLVVRR
jgi:L-histidine N-alpha-methyltransferase